MPIIYTYPTVTPVNDDLVLLSDVSDSSNITKSATISSILNLGVPTTQPTLPVNTLTLQGTTDTTTALAAYGINIAATSSLTDYCCRLPVAETGKEVIVINNSFLPIVIFPSMTGGEINGVVNGSAQIPADGRAYSFFCTENPLPGAWTTSPLATNQIEINEMEVAHVNGAGDTNAFNVGLGGANFPSAGMGISGGGTVLLTGDWRTESSPTTIARIKIYTNILWSDLGGTGLSQGISAAMMQGYKDSASSISYGQRKTASFYGSAGSPGTDVREVTGGIGSGTNVGDVGTLYMVQDVDLTASPLWQIIGNNYTQGISGILSSGFYTFGMFIDTTCATKTYKFQWFIEYY